jgi:microcystin-dependent protein
MPRVDPPKIVHVHGNLEIGNADIDISNVGTIKVDDLQIDGVSNPLLPSGCIIMWSGPNMDIPKGWLICDGNEGTPDLRDRFIVGSGNKYSINEVGGSSDAVAVTHTHSGKTNTSGKHQHGITAYGTEALNQPVTCIVGTDTSFLTSATQNTDESGEHTHDLSIDPGGVSGKDKNLPPYYTLTYIIKQ